MIGRYAGFGSPGLVSMQAGYAGAYGKLDPVTKAEAQVAKYSAKVANGQRCGFPPSKKGCERKLSAWQEKLIAAQMNQAAMADIIGQTSPEAAAAAIDAAVAEQAAAAAAAGDSTPYIVGGVTVLGILAAAAFMLFGGGK